MYRVLTHLRLPTLRKLTVYLKLVADDIDDPDLEDVLEIFGESFREELQFPHLEELDLVLEFAIGCGFRGVYLWVSQQRVNKSLIAHQGLV